MAAQEDEERFRIRGRLWIEGPEGTFLGYGRVTLLERIGEHGSISSAARSMEMSYRKAWLLVDSMNRQSRQPLVVTATGGKCGGGARLTETGRQAIILFRKAWNDLGRFLDRRSSGLEF